ncbi:MAG: TraR/DksA C4-type zinc finger protein [Alphaproteobacteria bacterium]|jgi:DnaK suppressor protein|nr:TraR/DksA C4-type zinc finger protein [Alphaproteobacteria bacterium]|tara:strand:- start:25 stop:366 length:342 start_codon:yes stop_codon:yes gene_type:complete
MHAAKVKKFKAQLNERRAEVQRLIEISKAGRDPIELDQSRMGRLSRMDAMQNQAMALEIERRRNVELQRIDAAMKRIGEDEFGFCLSCDGGVGDKRLSLDPTAPLCIDCAQSR